MACATPTTTVPGGGSGQSARCSRVFYLPPDCEHGIKLDGTCPPGTPQWFQEQVTRIEINSEVNVTQYGHDKSYCAQDATIGLASWNGTLTTKMQCVSPYISFQAGQIMWLSVWPLGLVRNVQIEGYAVITRDPIICNLERGEPVEHNYTYSSKGWWKMPQGISGTFDCCNCCQVGGGSGEEGSFEPEVLAVPGDGFDYFPVTAYQWNGTVWNVVRDECREGFMPGPAPTVPGAFAGALQFVDCLVE